MKEKTEYKISDWKKLFNEFKQQTKVVDESIEDFYSYGIKRGAKGARKALQNIRFICRDLRSVINLKRKSAAKYKKERNKKYEKTKAYAG